MARLTTLLFAMWLGVTVSTVVDLEKRIFGGQTCRPQERLYHVKLISTNGTHESLCGGSLISDRWILTAAHCFKPGWSLTAHIGVHPGPPTEVPITDPPVIFNDGQQHDLMLLKLPNPVVGIVPVQLPDCQQRPNINDTVQVAGHASTQAFQNNTRIPGSSPTLQCADLDVVDCQDLINRLNVIHYQTLQHNRWICASRQRVDTCPGDSGGGVVYKDRIYGVIARGDPTVVCAAPAIFMDLCHPQYLNWINHVINLTING